jgi:CPA1 family monovalent cation:H+ antiporter
LHIFRLNPLSPSGQDFLDGFWEFAAFLANSLIFLLIGLAVAGTSFDGSAMSTVSIAALLVLLGRAISVYGLCLPFNGTRWHIPAGDQHILWWGGLRGALALALTLALPETLAYRQEITITTFGVVALSVIVQGLTMPALMKAVGSLPFKRS